jgi:hypothetical protein
MRATAKYRPFLLGHYASQDGPMSLSCNFTLGSECSLDTSRFVCPDSLVWHIILLLICVVFLFVWYYCCYHNMETAECNLTGWKAP